ncbi:uncharacterized protein LOC108908253 [Anoplophora glabripennis]|uniref:uncharacterized protein LOC108908253 n=1 Tax=Anoplophora glabripennis TaxID=217634 RepID=UPI000875037F|nr:uncharacterized protein LOC108908253 [Anoplophora glabripennis]
MKFLLFACAFLTVLSAVYGAVAIQLADPDHPGHCYSDEFGQMNYGDEKTLENCVRAFCSDDGTISLASCGLIAAPCGSIPGDLSKPYPDCCHKAKSCE